MPFLMHLQELLDRVTCYGGEPMPHHYRAFLAFVTESVKRPAAEFGGFSHAFARHAGVSQRGVDNLRGRRSDDKLFVGVVARVCAINIG